METNRVFITGIDCERVRNTPLPTSLAIDDIRHAVTAVLTRVSPATSDADVLRQIRELLLCYRFEAFSPREAGSFYVRSAEMPGIIGDSPDRMMALRSSVEGHLNAMLRIVSAGMELPRPLSETGAFGRQPRRERVLTVRVTEDEMEAIKSEAALRSKSVSQLAREMLVYGSSSASEGSNLNTTSGEEAQTGKQPL